MSLLLTLENVKMTYNFSCYKSNYATDCEAAGDKLKGKQRIYCTDLTGTMLKSSCFGQVETAE